MRRAREAAGPWDQRPPVMLCDVNLLIAAGRPEHPHRPLAVALLQAHFDAGKPFGVAHHLLAAMVRICTNGRIFQHPTPLHEAFAAAERYRDYPHAVAVEPGKDHWRIFQSLVLGAGLTGGATSDAWHAALAIEHGCEWWTFDRDFSVQRFPGLRVRLLA